MQQPAAVSGSLQQQQDWQDQQQQDWQRQQQWQQQSSSGAEPTGGTQQQQQQVGFGPAVDALLALTETARFNGDNATAAWRDGQTVPALLKVGRCLASGWRN